MKTKIILLGILTTLSLQAESFSYTEYVNVTKNKPIYKYVTVKTPYKECWDEAVQVKSNYLYSNDNDDVVGSIIGGVAGGFLGNQIGKGKGKTVATVSGAIIGSLVGHNLATRDYQDNSEPHYESKRKCVTKYKEYTEKRFEGYKNVGFFKGKKIVKFSKEKLNTIPINITVEY